MGEKDSRRPVDLPHPFGEFRRRPYQGRGLAAKNEGAALAQPYVTTRDPVRWTLDGEAIFDWLL